MIFKHKVNDVRKLNTQLLNLVLSSIIAFTPFTAILTNVNSAVAANLNVTPANTQGWVSSNVASGASDYVTDSTAPLGNGALEVRTTGSSDKAQLFRAAPANTTLNSVNDLSYWAYRSSSSTGSPAQVTSINLGIDFNGAEAGGFTTLVFEPIYQSATQGQLTDDIWQNWDAGNDSIWWSSNPIPGAPNRDTFVSLATIKTNNPDAIVSYYGFNQGSGNSGITSRVDGLTFQGTTFDFEQAPAPAPGASQFIGSPKYVRVNNIGDITAQVRVPSGATEVRFTVDGVVIVDSNLADTSSDNDIYTVSGAAAGSQWYRLQKSLVAGSHTITAEFFLGGTWNAVTGSGVAYALDAPSAEYVSPNDAQHIFRTNDTHTRIKADDEFEQFKHLVSVINGVTYTVNRADCDLRYAGNYVLCDVKTPTLPEGTYTATTTTYTQANNRKDNFKSREFTIDNTRPSVLTLQSPGSTISTIAVSATAIDSNAVESVNFFLTAPRADGVCTGNGTVIDSVRIFAAQNGNYNAVLNPGMINGPFCVNATARDNAKNNSVIVSNLINVDTTKPSAPEILTPIANQALRNSPIRATWNASTDTSGIQKYEIEYVYIRNGVLVTDYRTVPGNQTFRDQTLTGSVQGDFTIRVQATDNAGHKSDWSAPRTYSFDTIAPQFSSTQVSGLDQESQVLSGTISEAVDSVNITITDSEDTIVRTYNVLVTDYTFNQTISGLENAQYFVRLEVSDAAGNTSVLNDDFTVNYIPPVDTVEEPAQIEETPSDQPVVAPSIQVTPSLQLATTTAIVPFFQNFVALVNEDGTIASAAPAPQDANLENGDILGAQDSLAKNAAQADSSKTYELFGIAWYWILAALAALLVGWWFIAGYRRRKDEKQA